MSKTTRKPAVDAEDEKVVTTVGPNDNILEALELPNADEWLAKAELAREIERLCRFLTTLGQDVRIVVQPTPRSRARGRVRAVVGAAGNAMNRRPGRGR